MSDTTTTTAATEAPRTWTPEDADELKFGEYTGFDAEPWRADKHGKELRGLLRQVEDFTSAFSGEQTFRIVIEDKDGVRWAVIPPAQLRRLFTERWLSGTIDIGKPISIIYDDDVELKNGRGKMKKFRVLPEPSEATARARAANAVARVLKADTRQPGEDFEDDIPFSADKKPKSVLDTMG